MRKVKRIILVGKAASGKDYLAETFIKNGFRKDISFTTRPPREGEENGVTYYFISREDFLFNIEADKLYEHVEFNGWMYGTSKDDWDNAEVFIMTPSGIATISQKDRIDCTVVYIDIPEDVRRERMNTRSDADTTERRMRADEKDFKGFIDYDYRIKNPFFDANVWVKILKSEINIEYEKF